MLGLREYQHGAHDSVLREWGIAPWWDGDRPTSQTTVANLATSAGKTIIAAHLANTLVNRLGKRVLFVGDREELIQQPVEKFHKACGIRAGIHRGSQNASPHAEVVVASIQTLGRRLPPGRPFDVIIDDECHRNTEARAKIHEAYPEAKVLGITATAFRKNMADLSKWYKTVAFELGTFDLIGQGYITPVKVLTLPLKVDLSRVHQKNGDFDQGEISEILEPYYEAVADAIKQHARTRQILAFLPLIKSSQEFASVMRREGLTARHCDGGTEDRAQVIEQFENREFQILTNSQVFSTGVDFIRCDCMLNLAATRSRGEYRQRAGRIMRIIPGTIDPDGVTLPTSEERRAAIAESEKPNCIAEGTLILTDTGLIPIEKVTKSMRVWDGTCYRKHAGAICNGEQETITYLGLTATPSHLVWTPQGWITFGKAAREAIPIAATADGRREIREADCRFRSLSSGAAGQPHQDAYALLNMRSGGMEMEERSFEGKSRLPEMRKCEWRSEMAHSSNEFRKGKMHKSELQGVSELRETRDSISFQDSTGCVSMDHGKLGITQGITDRSGGERSPLRAGQFKVVNTESKLGAYSQETNLSSVPSIPSRTSRDSIRRYDALENAEQGNDFRGSDCALESTLPQAKRRVWDILNCGPLHRFTAGGLLVHNCLILDVLWQVDKIGLAGPASIIAGSEEEEEAMTKIIRKKRTAEELEDISREVQQSKEEELRKALERAASEQDRKSTLRDAREIMLELHDHAILNFEPVTHEEARKVTKWQGDKLDRYGFTADSLTCSGQAAKLIDAIEGRQRAGMAPIQAFKALREAGHEHPESVTLDEGIKLLGIKFPNTFGRKHQGVPLCEVPKSYWQWLVFGTEAASRNSWDLVREKHPAVFRYITKIVFPHLAKSYPAAGEHRETVEQQELKV